MLAAWRHASRRSARLVGCGSSSSQRKCRPSRPWAASRSRSSGLAAELRRLGVDVEVVMPDYGGIASRRRDVVHDRRARLGRRGDAADRDTSRRRSLAPRVGAGDGTCPSVSPGERARVARQPRTVLPFRRGGGRVRPRRPARRVAPQRLAHRHGARRARRSAAERAVDPQPRLSRARPTDRGWPVSARVRRTTNGGATRTRCRVGSPSPTGSSPCRRTTRGRSRHGRVGSVSTGRCGPAARRSSGILNGIDTDLWNPATDPLLESTFDIDSIDRRAANRTSLLQRFGWPDDDVPLATVVTRLTHQKGIDLITPIVPLMGEIPMRIAVLGSGDAVLADELRHLACRVPRHVGVRRRLRRNAVAPTLRRR